MYTDRGPFRMLYEEVLGELTFWMSSYLCICILLCWINLLVYYMQEFYHLLQGVSERGAFVIFRYSAQKVIKDTIKYDGFPSIAYYHRHVLKQPMNDLQAKATNFCAGPIYGGAEEKTWSRCRPEVGAL
jgi:hypothetical protein